MTPIRILIADDEPLIRSALEAIIATQPGLIVVAVAVDAEEAIELAARTQPDVALLDVKMPGGGGAHAARGILERAPRTGIVAFSAYDDRAVVLDMLRAGATSYLVKGAPAEEIVATVVSATRGGASLSPAVARGVIGELTSRIRRQEEEQEERRELRARVRETIDEGRFESVFQPIVDLGRGNAIGVEALSRFSAEPIQSPDRWFADAGRAGLLAELELATAQAALAQLHEVVPGAFMSLNFSPTTLPRCGPVVKMSPSDRLVIEITEHAAIEDYQRLSTHLAAFRARGMRFAVDDTGAGYASLRHTLQLTPEFIKLDTSLTKGIDRDHGRQALATGLIAFANEISAEIVAEGIESRAERDTLRGLGVRYGQGYYLAAPAPIALLEDALRPGR